MMRLGVFIPARLASQRLPNKLMLPFGDSCLFDIACSKLNDLPNKYDKYVLVYEQELIDIAKQYSNIKIIYRERGTAFADNPLTYTFGDIKHTESTHLMFLNPCLAFLTPETIVSALEIFESNSYDYATSVKPFINWLFDRNGQVLTDINYRNLNTKDIIPLWQTAHCFHIFNKEQFLEDGMMLKNGHGLIPIPEEETIDVDTKEEYEYAKWKYMQLIRSKEKRLCIYEVDLDGTLCTNTDGLYPSAMPIISNIQKINELYDNGNTINICTARGNITGIDWNDLTLEQLNKWGVKYHSLQVGQKNYYDRIIDDKAINPMEEIW